jgi:predicted phosphodiesterase
VDASLTPHGNPRVKIQILSDIHNECRNTPYVPVRTDADVVVLAGDIGCAAASFSWAAQHFAGKRVIMVAGNHEPWGMEWYHVIRHMRMEAAHYGIDFLENDSVVIAGVKFVGATLFTDMQLFGPTSYTSSIRAAQFLMPDFKQIRIRHQHRLWRSLGITRPLHPEDSISLHRASRAFIESSVSQSFDGPVVVVSHHAPSTLSVEPRFQHEALSPCFASNLDAMIHGSKIALWVHGHTHTGFDYTINDTRVVCNALGYQDRVGGVMRDKQSAFRPDCVVQI